MRTRLHAAELSNTTRVAAMSARIAAPPKAAFTEAQAGHEAPPCSARRYRAQRPVLPEQRFSAVNSTANGERSAVPSPVADRPEDARHRSSAPRRLPEGIERSIASSFTTTSERGDICEHGADHGTKNADQPPAHPAAATSAPPSARRAADVSRPTAHRAQLARAETSPSRRQPRPSLG